MKALLGVGVGGMEPRPLGLSDGWVSGMLADESQPRSLKTK